MIIAVPTLAAVLSCLSEAKFWVGIGGVFLFLYRFITWFKDIRDKDLKDIHAGVIRSHEEIARQTDVLETGFKDMIANQNQGMHDLRDDFKTFFAFARPMMVPAMSSPAYKRKASVRKPAKSSRPTKKVNKKRKKSA